MIARQAADKCAPSRTTQTPCVNIDDERVGQLVLLLRRREKLTQRQLAAAAGVPRSDVMRIEAGEAGRLVLDRVRRVVAAAGGRARLSVWVNGAAADRLLDERHARMVERALPVLQLRHWLTAVEVTFADYGERGSVDILAAHLPTRIVAVCEVKTAIGSLEETNRSLDVKVRLAPKLARERFGWTPSAVGRILIVPDQMTIRRVLAAHATTMGSLYPGRSRDVRAWLRLPTGPLSAIWLLSEVANRDRVHR